MTEQHEQEPEPDDVAEQAASASHDALSSGQQRALIKVRQFPKSPGVYLFKDEAGIVIYVGKATDLRSRAGSYFLKAAAEDPRTGPWVGEICDADYIECDSEVDALLVESRLIKDIQPKHNKEQKDDRTFPYLMITTHEDFPRVEVTRRAAGSGCEAVRAIHQRRRIAWSRAGIAANLQVPHLQLGH